MELLNKDPDYKRTFALGKLSVISLRAPNCQHQPVCDCTILAKLLNAKGYLQALHNKNIYDITSIPLHQSRKKKKDDRRKSVDSTKTFTGK